MVVQTTLKVHTTTGVSPSQSVLIGVASGYPAFQQTPARTHTLQVDTTGSPSAATLQLEGSLDGTTWTALSPAMDVSSSTMFHVLDAAVAFVRSNLVTLTGGSSPTVTARYLGCQ